MENIFGFEKLEVYKRTLKFIDTVFNLCNKLPQKLQFSLCDQLRRASLSIANNIAEGSDKSQKAKIQFYSYSLNSARECIPMISICKMQRLADDKTLDKLREDCIIICKMLRKLISSVK